MPVEDPPTSTAIPLRPSAAARTTGPSTVSCSRGTYAGSAGSPGGGSSGCTGRCTSSANGSVTSASGRPAGAPACTVVPGPRSPGPPAVPDCWPPLEVPVLLAFRKVAHVSHAGGKPALSAAKPKITAATVPASR